MLKKRRGRVKTLVVPKYRFFKVLCAVTIVVASIVVFVGGVSSGASMASIVYECLAVTAVISVMFGLVIKAVESYEEIRGG
jgi:hypothetical protein